MNPSSGYGSQSTTASNMRGFPVVPNIGKGSRLSPVDAARELLARNKARSNFWDFFCYMDPTAKRGWWQMDAAVHLHQFYEDLIEGRRPMLIINAPPQHGKSRLIVDFIAWLFGKHPDLKTIYGSYSDNLGTRANKRLQRMIDSERYHILFPETNLGSFSDKEVRNSNHLEFVDAEGSFRNTTVRGSINGESLDIGVVDDPLKGREEAESQTIRDKTWDWFTDDFMTRFSDSAGMLMILTRWHLDDPAGRLIKEHGNDVKVVTYKAIAEEDEPNRKEGEALFPEFKSIDFLTKRKDKMRPESWQSLYQQNPVPRGGAIIKREHLRYFKAIQSNERIRRVHSWDTAQKAGMGNAFTVCTAWEQSYTRHQLYDVYRKRLESPDLRKAVIALANRDHPDAILIEDKSSGQSLIQDLRRDTTLPIIAIEPMADKVLRLENVSPIVEAGNVYLQENAEWLHDFIEELVTAPSGAYMDQCDSFSQYLNWIKLSPVIDPNAISAVGEMDNADW